MSWWILWDIVSGKRPKFGRREVSIRAHLPTFSLSTLITIHNYKEKRMARSKGKKVRYNKEHILSVPPATDIISELPRHLRETIVGFLPIEDAVRTSILSRKWRYCWTMIPNLIFEDTFVDRIMDRLIDYDDPELKAFKFVSVINKILLLHNGPIVKFSFNFDQRFCDSRIFHDYIDQWIPLLSRKGIKQLVLEDKEVGEFSAHHFSSLNLTHMKLIHVWFPYAPTFRVFPYLTDLELIHVEMMDLANSRQRIFECPVLEKLTLILCDGILPTNFSAPKLKCLYQSSYKITSENYFAGLENLTEFSFSLIEKSQTQTKRSNVDHVLGSLSNIEKFSVAMEFMQYLAAGHRLKTLSKPLLCLKTLNISDIYLNKLSEVSCLICLIRSAPNLCLLNISAKYVAKGDFKKYRMKDFEECTMDHLEMVTFSYFKGFKAEMKLVKFLLACSPLLKKMSIHSHEDLEKDVALMMFEEILQYPAASSRVQIQHTTSAEIDV
ncbi:hypothetical protein ACET3Z_014018 [Daucus carota]